MGHHILSLISIAVLMYFPGSCNIPISCPCPQESETNITPNYRGCRRVKSRNLGLTLSGHIGYTTGLGSRWEFQNILSYLKVSSVFGTWLSEMYSILQGGLPFSEDPSKPSITVAKSPAWDKSSNQQCLEISDLRGLANACRLVFHHYLITR